MEQRGHLVPSEQRRLSFRRFGVVAHVEDDGQLVVAPALLGKTVHPGTAALGGTTEVVAIEERFLLAILVEHLKHFHVGMIGRDVGTLLERKSIGTVGCIEHTIYQNTIHVEVRLDFIVADVQLLVLHLCRIVETVVGLQLEVRTGRLSGKFLDGLGLGISLRLVLRDQAFQESIHILRRLRHGVLQGVGSIVGIAHQLSLLCTQLGNLADDVVGVKLTGAVRTMNGSLIDLTAQVAVVETGQKGLLRGIDDDDGVWRLAATALGIFLALLYVCLVQSRKLLLAVHPHHGIISGVENQVAPFLLQVRDAQVDFLHAFLLFVRQQRALAHELLVGFLQQFLVLALQRVMIAVVHLTDTLEERHIERNLVLQFGQLGHHLLLNLTQFRSLVSLRKCKEHTTHAVKHASALLIGYDSVLESSRIGIVHNLGNLVTRLLDGTLKGRQIVGGFNLAEIRCSVGQRAFLQQWVLLLCVLTTTYSKSQCCRNRNGHNNVLDFHKYDRYLVVIVSMAPPCSNVFVHSAHKNTQKNAIVYHYDVILFE